MPIHDWQFWLVTLAASVALLFMLRRLLPRRRGAARHAGRGGPTPAARSTRATLTVQGRKPH